MELNAWAWNLDLASLFIEIPSKHTWRANHSPAVFLFIAVLMGINFISSLLFLIPCTVLRWFIMPKILYTKITLLACPYVCLFVPNKRQHIWTDHAQILMATHISMNVYCQIWKLLSRNVNIKTFANARKIKQKISKMYLSFFATNSNILIPISRNLLL